MTGMPFARQASIRRLAFSTTFCSFACSGEPESAKAPFSMITSFCRTWTISAVRLGSILKSAIARLLSAHERFFAPRDLRLEAVEAVRRADEHPLPVGTAPVVVADGLRDLNGAEMLSVRAEDPDALRPRDPDVAALVALH